MRNRSIFDGVCCLKATRIHVRSDFAFVCLVDCLTLVLFVKALHSSILVARIVLLGDTKMHWLCESRNLILIDVLTVSNLRFVVKLVRGDF